MPERGTFWIRLWAILLPQLSVIWIPPYVRYNVLTLLIVLLTTVFCDEPASSFTAPDGRSVNVLPDTVTALLPSSTCTPSATFLKVLFWIVMFVLSVVLMAAGVSTTFPALVASSLKDNPLIVMPVAPLMSIRSLLPPDATAPVPEKPAGGRNDRVCVV